MRQIRLDHNTRLETWIFLDRARAYLMLHEVKRVSKQRKSSCGVRPRCSQIMRFVACMSVWKTWRTLDMQTFKSSETAERN
jgi:hypothetical protein